MRKPSRYFAPYEDQKLWEKELARVKKLYPDDPGPEEFTDPDAYWREKDFDDPGAARTFADKHGTGDVIERVGITEYPEAPGVWEWTERPIPPAPEKTS